MGLERPDQRVAQPAGRGDGRHAAARAAPDAARHPDRAAGPVLLAGPPDDGRRHRRRAVRRPHRGPGPPRSPRGSAGAARPGRAQRRPHQPLSPPVLRRTASTHRDCPGAGPASEDPGVRRAGLCARRLGPGAGGQSVRAAPGRARSRLRLHRPRSLRGASHLRPGDGDVSRQGGGDRRPGPDLWCPDASLHPGVALGGPGAGSSAARSPRSHRARGRRPQPRQPAVGVPLPHPLLVGRGHLRGEGAGSGGARRLAAPVGLPLRHRARRRARHGAGGVETSPGGAAARCCWPRCC